MIFHLLLPFSLLSASLASYSDVPAQYLAGRATSNPDPTVAGSTDGGWQEFPNITDATAYPDWVVNKKKGAKLPVYQTAGLDTSAVKRAVIILPGKPRDCWYYWNVMNNALYVANANDSSLKREEISIMGPCFFNANDLSAGAAKSDQLVWGDTTWISGHYNIGPDSISEFSSYDVLDSLVDYYMDTDMYPNLNVVVIAGHSAGAQMAQRYIALRNSVKNDDKLHYWIANPGSILWLTEDRPIANSSCSGIDDYKYGLSGTIPGYATAKANKLERSGLVERYRERKAHYAWGLADDGAGDTRCEAMTQGTSHLTRGQNFVSMLEGMDGGMPQNTTVDWVEGASHDNVEMMQSADGIDKVCRCSEYASYTLTFALALPI
ncbi:hypothetical protein CPB85DRAFT_1233192 [Mucidula mucida]|nr:hypothetical protein CPB85DRAFT_1233192 [Mucidula mucida]